MNYSERTIQDYVKRTLGEPNERYGGPSKLAARKHATILRKLLKASDERRPKQLKVTGLEDVPVSHQVSPGTEALGADESLTIETKQTVIVDHKVSTRRRGRLRQTLTQLSGTVRFSVSSSLLSAIDRFSRSTWSSASSVHNLPSDCTKTLDSTEALEPAKPLESTKLPNTVVPPCSTTSQGLVEDLFSRRLAVLAEAKIALDDKCCRRYYPDSETGAITDQPLCLHLRILLLIQASTEDLPLYWQDIQSVLYDQVLFQAPLDVHGNSELFFATRVGAPVSVLLLLIERTVDLEAVNADGQTFLFFLNPAASFELEPQCGERTFRSSTICSTIRKLESVNFNFNHLDHHGRPFLFLVLALSEFDGHWLVDLVNLGESWRARLASVAQLKDTPRIFLSRLRHLLDEGHVAYNDWIALLIRKDQTAQTWQYIRTTFLHEEACKPFASKVDYTRASINSYSIDGRTPMMEFLIEATDRDMPSSVICEKLDVLLRHGALVNARCCPGGQTVLHLAAGRVRPKIVEFLLSKDINRNLRDDAGRTAYDYAWHLFHQSRKKGVSPIQAARSFQSLVVFEDDNQPSVALPVIHQRSGLMCQMLELVGDQQERLFASQSGSHD
jgi:hypothetical protein